MAEIIPELVEDVLETHEFVVVCGRDKKDSVSLMNDIVFAITTYAVRRDKKIPMIRERQDEVFCLYHDGHEVLIKTTWPLRQMVGWRFNGERPRVCIYRRKQKVSVNWGEWVREVFRPAFGYKPHFISVK